MTEPLGSEVARVGTYAELLSAIVARRKELGLTQMLVDEIGGLQSGYCGKLECGTKRLGMMSLECVLGALGLELAVVRTVPHHERQNRISLNAARGHVGPSDRCLALLDRHETRTDP